VMGRHIAPSRRAHAGRRFLVMALLLAGSLMATTVPASAYLHLTVTLRTGEVERIRWREMPVRWFISTHNAGQGISATALEAVVSRSFATWEAVPTADVSGEFGGFTAARPFDDDLMTVIGFLDEPDLERILGATSFLIDAFTGDILESDIFFNARFPWSVAAGGEPFRFDLESVAVHELGHLLGLGHSALGETDLLPDGRRRVIASGAVMFPIAFGPGNVADRQLQPDDAAGVSDLYPTAGFRASTGIARGRVRRAGRGVLGAHVAAFHLETGTIIAGFSLNEHGEFQIAGLRPGPHIIRVEPLDDAEVESFFVDTRVDIDFRPTFHHRYFVAPAGGAGRRFDVTVQSR
jgi:hypothetical protein